jgi:beta-lactamase superfamily II metal-dependent hydrolase
METPISTVISSVDVIKVDHHGSASSSNTTFLSVLNPTVAIIDVGTSKFHHPTQDALNRLFEAKSIIYQTQASNGGTLSTTGSDYIANGSIKITTDGDKQFNVYYGNEKPNHYSIK